MIHINPDATAIAEALVLYRNVLAEGTLSASSEAPDGFAANALGPQTFDSWTSISVPATLAVTLDVPVACDACAIIAHTLGSAGATVEVQYHDGSDWVTVQSVTPTDDRDLLLIFGEVSSTQWRIRITGAVASIGVAMIGPRLLIPFGVVPDYTPINLALSIELGPHITRGGQFLGNRVQRVGASTRIQLAPQERWWIEQDAKPFIAHYNSGKPFIWASCPDLLQEDMAYCWRSGDTLAVSYGAGAVYGSMSMEVAASGCRFILPNSVTPRPTTSAPRSIKLLSRFVAIIAPHFTLFFTTCPSQFQAATRRQSTRY